MHDVVQKRRHADVLRGGDARNRRNTAALHACGEALEHLFARQFKRFEVFFHELVVRLRGGFSQLFGEGFRFVLKLGGYFDVLLAFSIEKLRGHVDDIDIAFERAALDDGQLNRNHADAEFLVDLAHDLFKVCVVAVELVDDDHTRLVRLLAHRHGLFRADDRAGDRAYDDQRAVGQRHRRGDLAVKVKKAGCVDDIDLGVLPFERREGNVDGNAACNLLGIKVGGRGTVFHFAEAVYQPGVEQHGLRQRSLPFAAMSENANISYVFRGIFLHFGSPCRYFKRVCRVFRIRPVRINFRSIENR